MIEVIAAGALTSVQTADGRPGWRHLGVPVGGAADAWSARLANRLVGNPDDAALLELTLVGPELRFHAETAVALTGADFHATVDGLPLTRFSGRRVRRGALLRTGTGDGARAYLATSGGIQVAGVLGSMATDLRTGFGGHEGRALRAGDRLTTGAPSGRNARWTGRMPDGPIRIVPGPHHALLDVSALAGPEWTVGVDADRTGARLDGNTLRAGEREVASMGIPIGAIQVPPDGRPIVMLADRPVTGGYPVPACVIRADIGRVAALRTGDPVRFAAVSLQEARDAYRQLEDELVALDGAGGTADDEPGWAGALE
ncbi:MAG TPA: biotin-dependent carboxyltransferase family protein [Candidatus Limnocylindrales bacterium]|nr:biotin-dependent carboxyltransferase family protein [Candidatus Limnocylindrales bacterium]